MFDFLSQRLALQNTLHRFRQRTLLSHVVGKTTDENSVSNNYVDVDGKRYLNFSSNDYLALNNHHKINQALQQGADKYGLCSTGSSLISGYSYAHQALEEIICTWLNKPKCLLFNSGFSANSGVLQALGETHCNFYLDKLSHASIINGAYGSKAQVKRFLHNDIGQLTRLMTTAKKKSPDNEQLIVSEGVFSMDGDQANIAQLSSLARQQNSLLYIDDAHSIGVLGAQGQGSCRLANIDITMATFGKAIATSGAFVACDETVFEYLVNFCRDYIYSTAMSPAMAWATKASIELIQTQQWRRDKIAVLSQSFIKKMDNCFEILPSNSSIHAIVIGSEEKTLLASQMLKQKGIWLTAIRPPTVTNNKSRLRVTICANHKDNDIKYLTDCLKEISQKIKNR
ncbi:MAG: 7-keto-8-aminopelargonic acid synthetase [Gammaproteobacteria bacterium]|nr:MAG: 7-keto-8-aminopelargonic acid synthetase [Gammaproteobacteria bacterium]